MRIPIRLLGALVAVSTVFGVGLQNAYADSGKIALKVYKAGWIIGGSGGSGKPGIDHASVFANGVFTVQSIKETSGTCAGDAGK